MNRRQFFKHIGIGILGFVGTTAFLQKDKPTQLKKWQKYVATFDANMSAAQREKLNCDLRWAIKQHKPNFNYPFGRHV